MDEARWIEKERAAALDALDPRDVFGQTMRELAERYPLLSVVVSDYGRRLGMDELRLRYPDAVVQCGIAEQNQIEVAAALANEGGPVFAVSYTPFITARVLDQIRVNLGMMESPVIVVGLGSGYAVGELGASHMGLEDIAAMRSIPNVATIAPRSNAELALVLEDLAAHPRPAYVRISNGPAAPEAEVRYSFGKAQTLLAADSGRPVALIACGTLCREALEAAHELRQEGVGCTVVEMATVKPLDEEALEGLLGARLWVSVEEHSLIGGLGGALAEWLAERDERPALVRIAAPDAYLEAAPQAALRERAGMTGAAIAARVRERLA